ncbi:3-deoxy-D-manno-octulosonic acid transferase [Telmatobacter bradus]|uniref:3-deoxy-D-manno-octulosonic acid transferase n=1 Tax=Telmatobacter bradus TaxID=474953 RepID=UPI003B4298A3
MSGIILFFYNLALGLALVVSAPWWLWKMATTHKYRRGMGERLGFTRELTGRNGRPLLWLHAVSVGEVLAVSRLIRDLEALFPEHFIAISTTTRTGQDLAAKMFGAERVFYCPLDLPWAVRAWLDRLQPSLLILAETEFWPNLLSACFRRGVPVAVVNARISDRSWPRYRKLSALWKPFLSRLSAVLAQSPVDAERLCAIGCTAERVMVGGNLKFDVRAASEAEATRQLRALAPRPRFIVAGSTLEGEEEAFLKAMEPLCRVHSRMIKVIAPRHPERFEAVAAMLERSGQRWVRRSAWKGKPLEELQTLEGGEVVLLDTIGELASVYSLATIAFVGGSLIPAGGHNPLEPAQFAVPIVMGPNYQNFRAITEELRSHHALRITTREDFSSTLTDLLHHRSSAEAMGKRARAVFDAQSGATGRTIDAIATLLPKEQTAVEPAREAVGAAQ